MSKIFDFDRLDLGLDPVVRTTSGSRRRRIAPVDICVVHYVGAGWSFLDHGDSRSEIRSIDAYAAGAGKPNEYNWFVDSESQTFEYAGAYQAAHSRGDNGSSAGVCVLLGLETPNASQLAGIIRGIRRSRRQAVAGGILTPNHRTMQHRQMPGGKKTGTNCPGPALSDPAVWARIAAPLDDDEPKPDIHQEDMMYLDSNQRVLRSHTAHGGDTVTIPVGTPPPGMTRALVSISAADATGAFVIEDAWFLAASTKLLLSPNVDRGATATNLKVGGGKVGLKVQGDKQDTVRLSVELEGWAR